MALDWKNVIYVAKTASEIRTSSALCVFTMILVQPTGHAAVARGLSVSGAAMIRRITHLVLVTISGERVIRNPDFWNTALPSIVTSDGLLGAILDDADVQPDESERAAA